MPFVPIAGVVSMQAIWTLDNQNVENTFNYHMGGAISHAVLEAMAITYFNWVTAHVTRWPVNAACVKAYLRDQTSVNSFADTFNPAAPIDGTKSGQALPNSVSFAVKRETGLAGRSRRGRIYWIGVTDTDRADDNHIAVARAADYANILNTLLAAQLADNGATEVIVHRGSATYTPVTNYTYADLTLDNQRRRLPDHNRHH